MWLFKGEGAVNQAESLINLIKSLQGKRGLVYVRQHAIRKWLQQFLDKAKVRYSCINGNVTKERKEILDGFSQGIFDVLITSVTTALDADCDYVVFYEFTVDLTQMIGRADRGLNGKVLDIFYILTREEKEIVYFMENIYNRSFMIQQILGVDNSELASVANELEVGIAECGG